MSNHRSSSALPSPVLGGVLAGAYAVIGALIALAGTAATSGAATSGSTSLVGLSTDYPPYATTTTAPHPTRVPTGTPPKTTGQYQAVTGPGDLRLSIPVGWSPKPTQVTGNVQADDPNDPERFLRYGATPPPPNVDLLPEIQAGPRTNTSIQEQYRQISLSLVPFDGTEAVDWEFTYVKNGVTRHVRGYYWRTNGRSYVVYASAPADRWSTTSPVFDTMVRTATTG